jgi:hypothetical protein
LKKILAVKILSATGFGALVFMLTGSSGILWAPGSGSSGNVIFSLAAFIFAGMLPTEIAFWKAWKGGS